MHGCKDDLLTDPMETADRSRNIEAASAASRGTVRSTQERDRPARYIEYMPVRRLPGMRGA